MKVLGIIGPSGCGKSSLVSELFSANLVIVTPTVTDRPKRANEEELEHSFVSAQEFDRINSRSEFIEVVQPFKLPFRYGVTPLLAATNKVSLLMTRAIFVPLLNKHYPDNVIYQIEAPYSFAERQLALRKDRDLGTRLVNFQEEVNIGRKVAHRIFENNGNLKKLFEEVVCALEEDFNSTLSRTNDKRDY